MNLNSLTKNEKQVLIISVVLACFLLVWHFFGFFSKKSVKNNKADEVVNQQVILPPKFSRITFFHTTKPICTLAIPEAWEGKYRLQDSGGIAHFLYIQEDGNPELFYIKKYKKEEKINEDNEKKIWENKTDFYVSNLSTNSVDKFVHKEEFKKMIKDFDEIVKTFKCF